MRILAILLFFVLVNCGEAQEASDSLNRRSNLEFQAVAMMAAQLDAFRESNAGALPKNLTELFPGEEKLKFLLQWEQKFEFAGTNKGFQNQFLEKYVLMSPSLKMTSHGPGEILLLAKDPYLNESGELWRAAVKTRTTNGLIGFTFPEAWVQDWLSAGSRTVPIPPKLSPLPRAAKERTLDDIPKEEIERVLDAAATRNAQATPSRWPVVAGRPATNTGGISGELAGGDSASDRKWLWPLVLIGFGIISFIFIRARRRAN